MNCYKKVFVVFVVFILSSFVSDNELKFVASVKINPDFFTTDPIGNIYTVEGSVLKKFNLKGELIQTYSDKNRGSIYSVDASNPLKILLFYKDFRQIVFLSSNMTIAGDPILLDDLNIGQPILACTSYDNNFWIYDQQNMNLTRFDVNLQITAQSSNIALNDGFDKNSIKPDYIEEQSNILYLNNPATGILEFDKYGTYNKTMPFKGISSFQPVNSNLYFETGDTLHKYIQKIFEIIHLKLPDSNIVKTRISGELIMIQIYGEIKIYSISPENKD